MAEMTKIDYIPPMIKPNCILLVVYDGFEILDMSGPASVFSMANSLSNKAAYKIEIVSANGGEVRSSAGLSVVTKTFKKVRVSDADTVLVMGATGRPLSQAIADKRIVSWLARISKTAVRYGSVCTGAFVLASIGLLDGRRATTHWAGCKQLATLYPSVSVQPNALYVVDDRVWTSAGVTTGIDMALSMVERDLGAALMGQIAKRLVVYAHRPGNQSQFSTLLDAQVAANGAFSGIITWIDAHLDQPLKVEDMAQQAGMSERTFYRKFADAVGVTPSKYLQRARQERAKALLEAGMPVKVIAAAVGFRSEAGFRSAFEAQFDMSPSLHRLMHTSG